MKRNFMPSARIFERIKRLPWLAAIIYTIVAGAWILFSDRALEIIAPAPRLYALLQTYKGWGFVLTTGIMLYLGLRSQLQRLEEQINRREQSEHQNRRAEAETQTVRSYTDHLLSTANVIFLQLDLQGKVVRINEAAEEVTGYTRAEIEGRDWFELIAPRQRYAFVWDEFQRLIRFSDHPEIFENPILTHSGAERQVLWKNNILRSDGVTTGMISFGIDITEHKHAEELLRQRLGELEALHNTAAVLRQAQTRNDAMPILLEETLSAIGTPSGIIWLCQPDHADPQRLILQIAASCGAYANLIDDRMNLDDGIVGTVFTTGEPVIYSNLSQDPILPNDQPVFTPNGCAGAFMPIKSQEGTVGVLFVSMPANRLVTVEQVRLLDSLAEMAGATLHRMRLHEETIRRLEQLQALHTIDLSITAGMDLAMTLDILLEHVTKLLHVDAACVLLLEPDIAILSYAAGRGFITPMVLDARIHLGESFAGAAAQERRIIQVLNREDLLKQAMFADFVTREGFTAYSAVPLFSKAAVKGVLEVFHRRPFHPDPEWMNFLETLSSQAVIAIDNAQLFDGLQRANLDLTQAYDATIEGWSNALDLRDHETEGHSQRVSDLTLRLARWFGIPEAELIHIHRGALLHDMGKMGVPDTILLKKGPLDAAEWEIMRRHPQYAYDMLSPIAYLRPALDIPLYHHEKWDGSGYPAGLKETAIPLVARIFAVVDVWDALRSDRTYRKAWPEAEVLAHIRSLAGSHFDPQVVDAFFQLISA
jgi:PAS domain S-box-containing protein